MAFLEISVTPVGTDAPSISSFVAEACRVAVQDGVKYQVTATGTVLEGDLPRLVNVAQRMHEAAFKGEARRVVSHITIDERRDRSSSMEDVVAAARQARH